MRLLNRDAAKIEQTTNALTRIASAGLIVIIGLWPLPWVGLTLAFIQ